MTTLKWADKFLRQYSSIEDPSPETIQAVTELLKFHASLIPDSAESRLRQLENNLAKLVSDSQLLQMGGKK